MKSAATGNTGGPERKPEEEEEEEEVMNITLNAFSS